MIGYLVLVEDRENPAELSSGDDILFIEPEAIRREYSIPSAFAAYSREIFRELSDER